MGKKEDKDSKRTFCHTFISMLKTQAHNMQSRILMLGLIDSSLSHTSSLPCTRNQKHTCCSWLGSMGSSLQRIQLLFKYSYHKQKRKVKHHHFPKNGHLCKIQSSVKVIKSIENTWQSASEALLQFISGQLTA